VRTHLSGSFPLLTLWFPLSLQSTTGSTTTGLASGNCANPMTSSGSSSGSLDWCPGTTDVGRDEIGTEVDVGREEEDDA
jgi:hypothetical protein